MNTALILLLVILFAYYFVFPFVMWYEPIRKLRAWQRGWRNVIALYIKRSDQRRRIEREFLTERTRRLLELPIVWKWAVRFAQQHFDHTTDANCIVCAAKARGLRVVHRPFANANGAPICKVCSMPIEQWAKNPVCSGVRVPYVEPAKPQPSIKIIPTDW